MVILTLPPNPIWAHDRVPDPNQPTSDICHGTDIDTVDNLAKSQNKSPAEKQ